MCVGQCVEMTKRVLARADLPELIARAGHDGSRVSLYRAHDDDTSVIDNRAAGWVVFYTERGEEFDLRVHDSEDAACRDLLRRLGIATDVP